MWQPQAKHIWIMDGNHNTSFFHQKASNYKQRNTIKGLMDDNGLWQEEDPMLENIVLTYFSHIFQSNGPTYTSPVVANVQPIVTDSMNSFLCQPFQVDDVHRALKQMHPRKSSGLDGMPPLFYQHFWSLSGECVTNGLFGSLEREESRGE